MCGRKEKNSSEFFYVDILTQDVSLVNNMKGSRSMVLTTRQVIE